MAPGMPHVLRGAWGHPPHPSVVPPPLLVHTSCITPLSKSGGGATDPPFSFNPSPHPRVPPEPHSLDDSCLGREHRPARGRSAYLEGQRVRRAGGDSRGHRAEARGGQDLLGGVVEGLRRCGRAVGQLGQRDLPQRMETCQPSPALGSPVRQPLRKAESPRERF